MPKPKLLIPSAGRKVVLVRLLEEHFEVFPCGLDRDIASSPLAHHPNHIVLPRSPDPFLLGSSMGDHAIDAILPVRNEDALLMGSMRKKLSPVQVVSPSETLATCTDKLALYRKLASHHLHVPYTTLAENWREMPGFPLFAKDRYGSGSRVSGVVQTPEGLGAMMVRHDHLVIQPALKGQEYTLDMFFDWDSKLVQAVLRKRISVRDGQMDCGEVVEHLPFESFQKLLKIGEFLRFVGPINVQFIQCDEASNIIDINPRISGGIALTVAAGADFPRYLCNMVEGIEPVPQDYQTGVKAASYVDYNFGGWPHG